MEKKKLFSGIAIFFIGLLVLVGVAVYMTLVRPLQMAYGQVNTLKTKAKVVFEAAKTQNLVKLQSGLVDLQKELKTARVSLKSVFAYKTLPGVGYMFRDMENGLLAGNYLLEAGKKAVTAIEPYSDLIGFKKGSQFSQQPTEKRLETAILTIDKLIPQIDAIGSDLEKAQAYLEKIEPKAYPVSVGGVQIQEKVKNYHDQILGLVGLATEARPLFRRLPYLLGKDVERRYLVLFVNDAELRATGGFITAYAIFSVEKGQIRVVQSSDIYDLDNQINHPKAPLEITKYHKKVYEYYVRDSNLYPDYPTSLKEFERLLTRGNKQLQYDGIISVDTQVLVNTLKILGPTYAGGVSFTADSDSRCGGCPQVIYELENIITRPTPYLREQRKSMLSVLLFTIMQKSLGVSPSQYWGRLVQQFLADLEEKHILVNLKDTKSQKAIESLGYGGVIIPSKSDYLHVNNVNFAGAKSNMFMKQTVISTTKTEGDNYFREVLVEYRNPFPASDCNEERGTLCLNAPLRNWVRFYVPQGAKLVKFVGSEMETRSYEESGKQVFEGFLIIKPLGKASVKVTYTVPKAAVTTNRYSLLIQKQPGVIEIPTSVTFNGEKQQETMRKDTTFSF